MPLDPHVAAFYARKKTLENRGSCPLTIEQMRQQADAAFHDRIERTDIYQTEERRIPTPEGPIPVRLYWPEDRDYLPILLYFHGGGFIMHNLASHDSLCRMLAKKGRCLVVSVGYRLAPEFPYPAAVNDAYAALQWASQNASIIGGDAQYLYVGGDSAGANITAALCLMARDRKGPSIRGQLLFYGTYGCVSTEESESVRLFGGGDYVLPTPMLLLCEGLYTPLGMDHKDPYRYPGKAADLSGLPPAFSVTGEYDPLRDDGETFAQKLSEAGNEVTQIRALGMMHGFLLYWYEFDRAQSILSQAGRFLRAAKEPKS